MANTRSTAAQEIPLTQQVPLTLDLATGALGEIVLFIDGSTAAAGILEFTGGLAKQHGSRLIGIFVQPPATLTTAESFARGQGIREAIDVHDLELDGVEERYRAAFDNVVHRDGLRSEWRSLRHFSSEVAMHAYSADLVVVARPGSAVLSASFAGLAESLVLSSGRPTILFPPEGKISDVRRILLAWNATRESVRATADALPLLARAETVEVMVIDPERHRVIHDSEPGAGIAQHLTRHGVRAEVRRVSSQGKDVGQLMLSEAAAFQADLLVMGAYGHSQVREWVFGGVTRTVLYEAKIPVLMSR
jgi:nucleotide-binding universal stress UspA family protein